MNHEIRTPTNAILRFCELFYSTNLDNKQKKMLLNLKDSSKFLLSIINNILTFSSLEEVELTLDLTATHFALTFESIHEIVAPLLAAKKL